MVVSELYRCIAHSFDDARLSRCKVAHKFELMSEEMISQRLRRLPLPYNEIGKRGVDRILKADIMSHVEPSWTSPILLATKKDSRWFCTNFRKANAEMKSEK